MSKKIFGISKDQQAAVPDGKRFIGAEGGEQFFAQYFNKILFETQADWVLGTVTQITAGQANLSYDPGTQSFEDENGGAATINDGDRIVIIGIDTGGNILFSTANSGDNLEFIMHPDDAISLSGRTWTISSIGCRGNINVTGGAQNSLVISDPTSFLDIVHDVAGVVDPSGDYLSNGELITFDPQIYGNAFVNPRFDFWYEGVILGILSGAYFGGVWQASNSGHTVNVAQIALVGDLPNSPNFVSSHIITAAPSGNYQFLQNIEDVQTFSGDTVTISFYAYSDSAKDINVQAYQLHGSGGAGTVLVINEIVSLTTVLTKYTITANVPAHLTPVGADSSFQVAFILSGASVPLQTGNFDFTNLRIEKGSNANDDGQFDYERELARVRRFYQVTNVVPAHAVSGGTTVYTVIKYIQEMRVIPQIILLDTTPFFRGGSSYTGTGSTIASIITIRANESILTIDGFTGMNSGEGGLLRNTNVAAGIFEIDARL
jgi:hypothetical protein